MGEGLDDCAAMRITEMAKVRAKKTILEKTKYEFTAILPGVLEETEKGEELIYMNEPRLAICINFWTDKIKGI